MEKGQVTSPAEEWVSTEQLQLLTELEQQATSGPWETEAMVDRHQILMGRAVKSPGHCQAQEIIDYDHGLYEGDQWDEADANAQLIPAMRNALPALLAEVKHFRALRRSTSMATGYALISVETLKTCLAFLEQAETNAQGEYVDADQMGVFFARQGWGQVLNDIQAAQGELAEVLGLAQSRAPSKDAGGGAPSEA